MPTTEQKNAFGCPIYNQAGQDGILGFDALLAALPPELRAAFEAERAARQEELSSFVAEHGYNS